MFQAKTSAVLDQQLKVQEVTIRAADTHLYAVVGGDVCVTIGEPIVECVMALFHDNSAAAPRIASLPAADRIVSNSSDMAAGGDRKAIRLDNVAALDANDVVVIKYITVK